MTSRTQHEREQKKPLRAKILFVIGFAMAFGAIMLGVFNMATPVEILAGVFFGFVTAVIGYDSTQKSKSYK